LGIDLTSRVGLGILSGSETKCPWLKQPTIVKTIPGKLIILFKKYTVPSILKLKMKVVPEIPHLSKQDGIGERFSSEASSPVVELHTTYYSA
jgi:hypothetical protein